MARKTTRGKATKRAKASRAHRRTAKAAKKPRKQAHRTSPAKPAASTVVESTGLIDRLRAWSPSRYSTR